MWSNAPAGFEYDDWGNYIFRFTDTSAHGLDFVVNGDANMDAGGFATFGQPPTPFADRSEGVYRYFDAPM